MPTLTYTKRGIDVAARRAEAILGKMHNLWFDSSLYTPEALELLIKVVGADRVMLATECPGTGSAVDPKAGRSMDDTAHWLRGFVWLSDADRQLIFEGNARKVYKLDKLLDR